jgi:preprotein translocase subunit YajC
MIAILLLAATKSGSSNFLLPIMLVGFGLIYFFVLRPRQRKMKEQQAQTKKASVGDTIETIGGVRGVVLSEDDKYIVVATGGLPGDSVPQPTTLTFLKQAIARKVVEDNSAAPTPEVEAEGSTEGEDE